jgi:uncharacterized protein (DUF2235 family)
MILYLSNYAADLPRARAELLLANNYHPGDTIHLFGFSRGAYTARSVGGLIILLGILTKKGMDSFYQIYSDYTAGKLRNPQFVSR